MHGVKQFVEFSREVEGLENMPFENKESLRHEILRYHFKYKPELKIRFVYKSLCDARCMVNPCIKWLRQL